jgi:hypothetical protein
MPLHPAWAKNVVRRVLWAAGNKDIDKNQRKAMANFFGGCCAYCGITLPTKWHADHLVPVDQGGTNYIINRVPACPKCNEGEKQDQNWLIFIRDKYSMDPETAKAREDRIRMWIESHPTHDTKSSEDFRAAWETEVAHVSAAIDLAWQRLKSRK